jgi:hypothetical protein
MTKSSLAQEQIIVGVDTHKDVHVAVASTATGGCSGSARPPPPSGAAAPCTNGLWAWLRK